MHYTYILQSKSHPAQTYIGSTSDLRKRLAEHNAGKSIHTSGNSGRGKSLRTSPALPLKTRLAEKFERYLKTGSGRAFAKSHLLPKNGRDS